MVTILITGSSGQIGSDLIPALVRKYGKSSVITSDITFSDRDYDVEKIRLDVTKKEDIETVIKEKSVTDIFHLGAILSASAEKHPYEAFFVNGNGTLNVMEAAVKYSVNRIIIPSSIAVFGNDIAKEKVKPMDSTRPTTMYGITKVLSELLAQYYTSRYGISVRGMRFPGIISYETPPMAGTTDYAVDMFIHAVNHEKYKCYLKPDTPLPMMYFPDAIDALVKIFEAEERSLRYRMEYNVSAFTFTPSELYSLIKEYYPDFSVEYEPDYRQNIAESWPHSLDYSDAVKDWGYSPRFSLNDTVKDMIVNLERIRKENDMKKTLTQNP